MHVKRCLPVICILVAAISPRTVADPPFFTGLGDLPGGIFGSYAYSVSGDGLVAVGFSQSASGAEAFRWTLQGGMVGLGDLPGGTFDSLALDASADGSVIVGHSYSATRQMARGVQK